MKALQRAAGLGRSPANARRLLKAYENALNGVHVAEHDLVDPDAADPGSDNEPKVMLCYVAEALDAVEPVGARVFDALASPVSWEPASPDSGYSISFSRTRSRPFHTYRMM